MKYCKLSHGGLQHPEQSSATNAFLCTLKWLHFGYFYVKFQIPANKAEDDGVV